MRWTLFWAGAGLLLGLIIHIVSILWVPAVAENDAWARLGEFGPANRVNILPVAAVRDRLLPDLDPSMRHAVCLYDLADGPLRIHAAVPPGYWSVALYDRRGVNYYALNDRLIGGGRSIELWIATREQLLSLEESDTAGGEGDAGRLVIGAPREQGFALFRLLVAVPSDAKPIEAALGATTCGIVDLQTVRAPGGGPETGSTR